MEERIARNFDDEEEKKIQSFYESYLQDKISPEHLRLIHRRNILVHNEREELEKLFQKWHKNGLCTEEERKFLWTHPNTGKWIYKPDVHDWSVECPFKDCHIEYGWEQRKNPKCR